MRQVHNTNTWHFQVPLPQTSDVYVGEQLWKTPEIWPHSTTESPQQAMVFIDQNVAQLFPDLAMHISQTLKQRGWLPQLRPIEASESLKAFDAIYPLYAEMLQAGMRRQSLIVAVGGGTVGDAIGFLAATYLRGIAWVNIPTTLLAQVDSSLGGKTGINHAEGKNLIGAFHQPRSILCDTHLLGDLPERERISGLGEMLKYGLIADADFWKRLCEEGTNLRQGKSTYLAEAIAHSLKIKAHYVAQDEYDLTGVRAALNFGHTFAHGIEAAAGYGSLRHGEAVLLGMELAIRLSVQEGLLPEELSKHWLQSLQKISCISLKKCLSKLCLSTMLEAMKKDKKNENSNIRILLIKDHGDILPKDFSVMSINIFLKGLL